MNVNKTKKNYKKTNINIQNLIGGENAAMDLQSLTAEDIAALKIQGILPEQIAQMAVERGQPIPPILLPMLPSTTNQITQSVGENGSIINNTLVPSKASKFPAQMDIATYGKYKNTDNKERAAKMGAHKPNVFGYVFSDLISEEILSDMKRTQGSFFVGVNLSNLFNEFKHMIVDDENDKNKNNKNKNNSSSIFKKVGEWIDVDFDDILESKMGYRGSDVPLLPENELSEYSSFYEVIDESKKYADTGFDGKITALGLLIMTRMLYKYKKNTAQWIRVATILELIYKYLGNGLSREEYFKSSNEIPIMSLMDLEEFYNTDHIFMTVKELEIFKKSLDFYKYDNKMDITSKLAALRNRKPPVI